MKGWRGRNVHSTHDEQRDKTDLRLSTHPQISQERNREYENHNVEQHIAPRVRRETRKQLVAMAISFDPKCDALSRSLNVPVLFYGNTRQDDEERECETPDSDKRNHSDGGAAGAWNAHLEKAEVLEENGEFDEGGAGCIVEVRGEDILETVRCCYRHISSTYFKEANQLGFGQGIVVFAHASGRHYIKC
jgi:hypothetical protein